MFIKLPKDKILYWCVAIDFIFLVIFVTNLYQKFKQFFLTRNLG